MAKRYVLIDPAEKYGPDSKYSKSSVVTDYDMCSLCQKNTCEKLQCPAKWQGVGYKSLADDICEFEKLGKIPMKLDISRLNDGSGIESTLRKNKASWHKSCRANFNKTKLSRLEKQPEPKLEALASSKITRHKSTDVNEAITCFFCEDEEADGDPLHEASSFDIDNKVRQCAIDLGEKTLIAKLSAGDMIAIEAKYHRKCLAALYNRHRGYKVSNQNKESESQAQQESIAFAELLVYIEDCSGSEDIPIFKLKDLKTLYEVRLKEMGVVNPINSTRLKEKILDAIPDISYHQDGRDGLFTFNVGRALQQVCNHDAAATHLAKAAQIIRKDIFQKSFTFKGFLKKDKQEIIPDSLLTLISMIMEGPNITQQTNPRPATHVVAQSISQLLIYNSSIYSRKGNTLRHSKQMEPPLPIYIAMKTHALTRSRELVTTMHELGLCISYHRLMKLTADMANGVCNKFREEQIVCPSKLRKELFTTMAMDNIDHNLSSTTAQDSFHGTGISVIQHPTTNNHGQERPPIEIDTSSLKKTIDPLPDTYTTVPPASLKSKQIKAPAQGPEPPPNLPLVHKCREEETKWLDLMMKLDTKENISWSAFHSQVQSTILPPPAIIALLPLFM